MGEAQRSGAKLLMRQTVSILSVLGISRNGKAHIGAMYPKLVRPSCQGLQLQMGAAQAPL